MSKVADDKKDIPGGIHLFLMAALYGANGSGWLAVETVRSRIKKASGWWCRPGHLHSAADTLIRKKEVERKKTGDEIQFRLTNVGEARLSFAVKAVSGLLGTCDPGTEDKKEEGSL